MNKTKTLPEAAQAHIVVEEAAALRAAADVRTVKKMKAGEIAQQGDVYLLRLDGKAKPEKAAKETSVRQLAPGNNPGARHVIDPDADVSIFNGRADKLPCQPERHALFGPMLVARGPFCLMHPEHGHIELPAGNYQTFYQVDAVTMQRVQD